MGLLGKDSITITDITDVNPIRLDLASSQPIYQTKRASGYEPDYTSTSSPLIITPSLYFGQEEVNREKYIDGLKEDRESQRIEKLVSLMEQEINEYYVQCQYFMTD